MFSERSIRKQINRVLRSDRSLDYKARFMRKAGKEIKALFPLKFGEKVLRKYQMPINNHGAVKTRRAKSFNEWINYYKVSTQKEYNGMFNANFNYRNKIKSLNTKIENLKNQLKNQSTNAAGK